MNFTTTLPTKPGAYWWRAGSEHAFPRLFEVWASGQVFGDLPSHCRDKDGNKLPVQVEQVGGEWCGPLVPVQEVEAAWFEASHGGPGYLWARYQHSRARKIVEGEILP